MDTVSEILARLMGPLILTAALGAFFYNNDQLNALVTIAKNEYMSGEVYSQGSTEYSEDGIEKVTGDQLRSIIAAGTDYVIIIEDVSRMRKYVIIKEADGYVVEMYRYSSDNPNGSQIAVNIGVNAALAAVNGSSTYDVTQENDLSNNIRRVVYRKV